MLEWIDSYVEHFGCDWETAAREYYAIHKPNSYRPEDYEEYCDMYREYDEDTQYFTPDIDDYGY